MSETPTRVGSILPDLEAFWELALRNEAAERGRELTEMEKREARHGVGLPSDPVIRKLESVGAWPPPDDEHQRAVLADAIHERRFDDADIIKELDRLGEEAAERRQEVEPTEEEAWAQIERLLGKIGVQPRMSGNSLPDSGALTPEEIMAGAEEEESGWIPVLDQNGFFLRSRAHLLAGPDTIGKTEFLYQWATGLEEKVVWLSEESLSVWQRRFSDSGTPKNLNVVPLGRSREEYLKAALRSDATVVVVDSLRGVIAIDDENDAGQWNQVFRVPWIHALVGRQGKTLVCVHHFNAEKEIAGSRSLRDMHDTLMTLTESGSRKRTLSVRGRRPIEPKSLQYQMDKSGAFAPCNDVASRREKEVLRILETEADRWMVPREILEELGENITRQGLLKLLKRMAKEGKIASMEPGDKGDLWLFRFGGGNS